MIKNLKEKMVNWRHDIHKHPELGFAVDRTAHKVSTLLKSLGLEVHVGIGNTGIVAILKNGNSQRAIGLRADMDALPIQEENNFAYRSINKNMFHGCGHDGHTCMLLGAAHRLVQEKNVFDGVVYFIFQPSEEDGKGALAMINDGLFDRFPMTEIYGLHNMPGIPAGQFAVREGSIMTSESTFSISINGKGGHASMPSRLIDPVVVGAEIILALQTIVSRSLGPDEWGVVSITEVNTDGARNVVPSNVTIKGDCRALLDTTQEKIGKHLRQIVAGICAAYNTIGKVTYEQEFIVTVNTPLETKAAIHAAQQVAGKLSVDPNCPPCGASEDFAQMLAKKPGCYMLIGNGMTGHCGNSLHNPNYDLNDGILDVGCNYWVTLVKNRLPIFKSNN